MYKREKNRTHSSDFLIPAPEWKSFDPKLNHIHSVKLQVFTRSVQKLMSGVAEMSQHTRAHTHTLSLEDTHPPVSGGHTALLPHQMARSAQFSGTTTGRICTFLKLSDRQCLTQWQLFQLDMKIFLLEGGLGTEWKVASRACQAGVVNVRLSSV